MPDNALISIADARTCVLSAAVPLAETRQRERVAVAAALDRVLATDVQAAGDVPPFACSAMDGYAIVDGPAGRTLTVVAESRAGHPVALPLPGPDTAIRISTGAAVPEGATAVIRQEDTETAPAGEPAPGGAPRFTATAATGPGENIRRAGEDLRAGGLVLPAGSRLGVAELGAAVAAGVGEVTVTARPTVAILCTGDELRAPGEPLGPGEIHNSNAVTLAALAARSGAHTVMARRVPDDPDVTRRLLGEALESAEIVVISGGVSVGPHDHVKPALAELGVDERFWGVALQPGKPTWFGTRSERLVFGLPGNPVSAVVTFVLFVGPSLAALQGHDPSDPASTAILGAAVRRNARREQAVRVALGQREGRLTALPTGAQGSHLMTSLLGADALALIPAGEGELEAGARVAVIPLPR